MTNPRKEIDLMPVASVQELKKVTKGKTPEEQAKIIRNAREETQAQITKLRDLAREQSAMLAEVEGPPENKQPGRRQRGATDYVIGRSGE